MQFSKIIAIVIAVISILWILSGVFTGGSSPAPENSAPAAAQQAAQKIPEVRIKNSKAALFDDVISVTGRSQASRTVSLRAETSGQIESIEREEGALVEADDVLAKIEINDRQARYEEAKQRAAQRQIQYDASKKLQDKGFNSKVRLAEALADLEDAKALMKNAQVDLAKTTIKAPFEGVIAAQEVDTGDYLSVGDTMFTIVDLNPVEIVGYVSEQDIKKITLGAKAHAVFLDNQKIDGEISFIAPAADAQTRTFRVIMSADNTDMAVKEGLTASLRIPIAQKSAHKISSSILSLNDEGMVGVKIVDDQNIVRFVPVKILSERDDGMYVSGLPDTARIITVGQDFVNTGESVKPVAGDEDGSL
jgi:multidrug efflux system membrane fusion protein